MCNRRLGNMSENIRGDFLTYYEYDPGIYLYNTRYTLLLHQTPFVKHWQKIVSEIVSRFCKRNARDCEVVTAHDTSAVSVSIRVPYSLTSEIEGNDHTISLISMPAFATRSFAGINSLSRVVVIESCVLPPDDLIGGTMTSSGHVTSASSSAAASSQLQRKRKQKPAITQINHSTKRLDKRIVPA